MAELLSLREAVAGLVRDGDVVAMEGFTHLIPHAAGHEVIRQGRKDLTLVRMTPDLIYDQLIGMGCARKLVFSWGGNPGVGSLHRLRDAVEQGWPQPLEIEEHSHAGLANAYVAGAAGLPFAVLRGYIGSDLPTQRPHPAHRVPVHRRGLAAVPAIRRLRGHPCAEGRPQGQRPDLGHPRRPEGGGARGQARCCVRSRRSSTAGCLAERLHPAALGGVGGVPRAGRRLSVLRPGLLRARQPLLPAWDTVARNREAFRLDAPHVLETDDFRGLQARARETMRAEAGR